ncbi:hypothetical protein B0H14DRAFT_3486037 [Mycena olivaceomarginata]|nr:hypothetical protein B0H14DRAFT_3486037 [Mycena olivaceomarginata]
MVDAVPLAVAPAVAPFMTLDELQLKAKMIPLSMTAFVATGTSISRRSRGLASWSLARLCRACPMELSARRRSTMWLLRSYLRLNHRLLTSPLHHRRNDPPFICQGAAAALQ